MISFGYVDFYAKIILILYTPFENSTTHIAITYLHCSTAAYFKAQTNWGTINVLRKQVFGPKNTNKLGLACTTKTIRSDTKTET